ncbi:pre-rrna processing protein, partial [Lasius niger]
MRSLCSTTPKGIRWRDERSWMLADDIKFASQDSDTTIITGVVRGRGLKADRLVQVGDWGTYQIQKIVAASLPKHNKKVEEETVGGEPETVLEMPSGDQDDLDELAPDDVVMDAGDDDDDAMSAVTSAKKGVLLDDYHYFSDEEKEGERKVKKRVPKGT